MNSSERDTSRNESSSSAEDSSRSEAGKNPRKKALRRTHFRMIRDVTDVTGVLDYIHSKMEISKATRQRIQAERTSCDQARELISLVETLGDEGYDIFRDALLRTEQPNLANILPAFGKMRFLLGNVSQLQEEFDYLGDVSRIAGASWRLGVKVTLSHGSRRVRIFLKYEPRDAGEERFLVNRELTLVRQNPKRGMKDIVKRAANIFPNPLDGWTLIGSDMIDYDPLMDPANGWLQNDSMLVHAQVEVETITLGHKVDGRLTFVLDGVREKLLERRHFSDPQVVCGVRWRIVLFARMEDGKKYLAVGMYGEEEDFNGRRYNTSSKFTLVRQSGSQTNLVSESVGVLPDQWSGKTDSGNRTFIPFDQLIDPQQGWLNRKSLEVTCDITLIELQESDD